MNQGSWPHHGLNATGSIQIEQLEVWQIPNITTVSKSNTVPDIFDTGADTIPHDNVCKLPGTITDSMTFRNDISALAAPVASLGSGLQSWLLEQLQKLDKEMAALAIEEQKINDEQDFMSYHFSDVNTSDNTDRTTTNKQANNTTATSKSNKKIVKGVYNGIKYTVLHGELICTTQVTAEELKSNWLSDVTAADINSDGYIVQEFDYECFRKLINVMRLKSMLKSPQCKLPIKYKKMHATQVPPEKRSMLSCMLTSLNIPSKDFYAAFDRSKSSTASFDTDSSSMCDQWLYSDIQ
jgi:UDP-2,3-diacylglucosamine pyrophosphatase LpxH